MSVNQFYIKADTNVKAPSALSFRTFSRDNRYSWWCLGHGTQFKKIIRIVIILHPWFLFKQKLTRTHTHKKQSPPFGFLFFLLQHRIKIQSIPGPCQLLLHLMKQIHDKIIWECSKFACFHRFQDKIINHTCFTEWCMKRLSQACQPTLHVYLMVNL